MARVLLAILLLVSACGGSQLAEVEASPTPELTEGRVALAAAQGEPHILWFWGAN